MIASTTLLLALARRLARARRDGTATRVLSAGHAVPEPCPCCPIGVGEFAVLGVTGRAIPRTRGKLGATSGAFAVRHTVANTPTFAHASERSKFARTIDPAEQLECVGCRQG